MMEVDDIISYHDVVAAEKIALQKGMNYGIGKDYSVFLMSLRENAPYADALDPVTGMLTYEGHDEPQRRGGPNPKEVDQPLTTPRGSWTEKRICFAYRAVFTAESDFSLLMMNFPEPAFFLTWYASFAESYDSAARIRSSLPFQSRFVL